MRHVHSRRLQLTDVPDQVESPNANTARDVRPVEPMEAIENGRNRDEVFQQWVVEKEGKVLAYADCGIVHATKSDDTDHLWVTVHPDFGGKGYGVSLYNQAVRFTLEKGISKLITACA